jgi:hypothetical protein
MSLASELDMARPKKPAKPEPKPTVISLKGSDEWREWLRRYADFCRTDAAKLIDAALITHAKIVGFTEKPPRR